MITKKKIHFTEIVPEYSNFMTLSGMLRNWGLWRPVVRIHPDEPSTKYE